MAAAAANPAVTSLSSQKTAQGIGMGLPILHVWEAVEQKKHGEWREPGTHTCLLYAAFLKCFHVSEPSLSWTRIGIAMSGLLVS